MNKNLNFKIVVLILLLISIYSISRCTVYKETSKSLDKIIEAMNDTITIWKDKNNISHSKISVLETTNVNDFLKLKIKDEEIKELQNTVDRYKKNLKKQGSVTNFTSVIKYDTIYKNNSTYDTIFITNNSPLYDSINNNWIKTKFGFTVDSVIYSLVVNNKYSVIIGQESQGLFKSKKTFAEVINYNPYSETNKLRTYQVQTPTVKRFGIGPFAGYGVTNNFQFQPFIGIGVQYSLIRF